MEDYSCGHAPAAASGAGTPAVSILAAMGSRLLSGIGLLFFAIRMRALVIRRRCGFLNPAAPRFAASPPDPVFGISSPRQPKTRLAHSGIGG
jgi:hypothetical protein